MKKKDYTNPYANLGINKTCAPKKSTKDDPKGAKFTSVKDLRGGKK